MAVQELLSFPDPPDTLCYPALSGHHGTALVPPSPQWEKESLGVRRRGFSAFYTLLTQHLVSPRVSVLGEKTLPRQQLNEVLGYVAGC